MTRLNPAILIPSGYALAGSLAFALMCLLLIGVDLAVGWGYPLALVIAGFMIGVLFFGQVAIGTLSSALTAAKTYAYLNQEPVRLAGRLPDLRSGWLDLIIYSLARPGLWVSTRSGLGRETPTSGPAILAGGPDGKGAVNAEPSVGASPTSAAAGPSWMSAAYLVIPILAIEKLNLKGSLARAVEMIQNHALRLNAALIGVRSLSWITGAIIGIIGLAASLVVYLAASPLSRGMALREALFACLSLFIFDGFFLVALTASAYINTAYATCLYLWSANAEKARRENQIEPAHAPVLLAAALEK